MNQTQGATVVKKRSAWREWVDSFVIAAALVIFLRTFFFQIYKIPTTSMVPTLVPGDQIFVSKLVYGPRVWFTTLRLPGFGKLERGDVVVFVPPNDRHKPYIKRLIGLPGDTIVIGDGRVSVNGKIIVDPRIANIYYYNNGEYARSSQPIVIPKGKYFFLGDNSMASLDSRFWGFVDELDILGKAIFIWWPLNRVGMIE